MQKPQRGTVLVVIPARGGSKGLPLKTLRPVGGKSLLARGIDAALAAPSTTDVVLLQCTSPFINPAHVEAAVRSVLDHEADVCFSVTEDHSFIWSADQGAVQAVGHDAGHRPRRQDRTPQYRETGAFYAMRTTGFRQANHRFFGRLKFQLVPPSDAPEVDSPEDLDLVCAMATRRARRPTGPPLPGIDVDALVTDFDGVHANDVALLAQDGSESVTVSRSDGMGVARLRQAGVPMLILSTETNTVVATRAAKLGVDVVHGVTDKAERLGAWIDERGLDPARVAYVGNDVAAMDSVGWPIAVADARPEALAAARIVLQKPGGSGAVREVCERILETPNRPTAARLLVSTP